MPAAVAQFMLARQRQAWHRDGTQLGGGQMRQDGLRTVLQEQGDTMPTRHAEPLELHGQPRRQLIEFAPADRAAVPQQGDALGGLRGVMRAIAVQRHLAREILDRFAVMGGHGVSPRSGVAAGRRAGCVLAALDPGRS